MRRVKITAIGTAAAEPKNDDILEPYILVTIVCLTLLINMLYALNNVVSQHVSCIV